MHLSLTSRQMICLFCAVVSLSCLVVEASSDMGYMKQCCPKVSPARIRGQIKKCAYLPARRLCLEAYVLTTDNGRDHCVSVSAKWVNSKLEMLKQNGTICEGKAMDIKWRK